MSGLKISFAFFYPVAENGFYGFFVLFTFLISFFFIITFRSFGVSGSDFMELSDANRTSFKWELFLVPLKLSLAIMLPTLDRKMFSDIYQEIVKYKGNKGTIIN